MQEKVDMRSFGHFVRQRFNIYLFFGDTFLSIISFFIALSIRLDFNTANIFLNDNVLGAFNYSIIAMLFGIVLGIYSRKYKVGSIEEILAISSQAFFSSLVLLFIRILLAYGQYPRSVPVIASLILLLTALFSRVLYRLFIQRKNSTTTHINRIMIFGAGSLGGHISNLVLSDPNLFLVGFIDDDIKKSKLTLNGRKVLGNSKEIEEIIVNQNINQIIIAIANIDEQKLREISAICVTKRVRITSIPSAGKLLLGLGDLSELISLNEENILGRSPINTSRKEVGNFLRAKRILVTGAGGSIGSEIVKQCLEYQPEIVYALDRDETALHSLELEISGTGLLSANNLVLADIRDADAIAQIFSETRPDIVFHAAALKHLPILENFPGEAHKTNVMGTQNVIDAAKHVKVEVFVNISTDKAADPTSVLGKSKLEAEKITAIAGSTSGTGKFLSVRFGNVIGSRGSVLHTFKYQIDHDLPITLTDSEVTRYFMTVKEAVSLVLQSAVIGENCETLILDMGSPVRIEEVARFLLTQSGKKLPIIYTGLRKGEKLNETLSSSHENLVSKSHPKIFHTKVILNE